MRRSQLVFRPGAQVLPGSLIGWRKGGHQMKARRAWTGPARLLRFWDQRENANYNPGSFGRW